MARSFYFRIVLLVCVSALFWGCTKYDEGGMSFSAKKRLLQQTWVLDTIIDKSTTPLTEETSGPMPDIRFDFKKDGSFFQNTTTIGTSFSLQGTWDFTEKRESLQLEYNESDFLLSLLGSQEELLKRYSGAEQLKQFPVIDFSNISIPNTFTILRLKKDECWLEYAITIPLYITSISIRYEIRLKAE